MNPKHVPVLIEDRRGGLMLFGRGRGSVAAAEQLCHIVNAALSGGFIAHFEETERLQAIEAKAREVRLGQKNYFKTRGADALRFSKDRERELDELLDRESPTLFPAQVAPAR